MLAALALSSALAAPPLALARYAEAVDAALRGDRHTALDHFNRVRLLDPSVDALLGTARWRVYLGDLDGARRDLDEAAQHVLARRACEDADRLAPDLEAIGESEVAREVSRRAADWRRTRRCAP
jgi:hypothetical protein